jgi:signal transduction histidine kinase
MAFVLVLSRDRLERPVLGAALVGAALAVTVAATALWRTDPAKLLRPPFVLAELTVGFALVAGDGLVRRQGEAFTTGQSLGSVWPLVGVLSAGVAGGPAGGVVAGIVIGLGRFASTLLNDVGTYDTGRVLSLTSTVFFYAMAGGVAGYAYRLIVKAREEVAAARAREDVARTLHDGVLQTLALVERRATDPALARLAREQERDLRAYLFGDREAPPTDLGAALRAAAGRFENAYGGRTQVLVADDLPPLTPERVAALAGAVGEALTNAGKHGDAGSVVVYVEGDDDGSGVFCSVKDDGTGFDHATTTEGVGLARSIRGRLAELGGRAEIDGGAGAGTGTEVRLWLPAR